MKKLIAVLAALFFLVLMACSGGGNDGRSSSDDGSTNVDVSGTWKMTITMSSVVAGLPDEDNGTITLLQNGTNVTGTFQETSSFHGTIVDGTLNGNSISFTKEYYSSGTGIVSWHYWGTVEGNLMQGKSKSITDDSPPGWNELPWKAERQ